MANEKAKFQASDHAQRSSFTRQLLDDVAALEQMLERDAFESGVQRLGAEQEFCLIDYALQPLMAAMPMLDALQDEHFTTELARFNLELNLDPLPFSGTCFSELQSDLTNYLTSANRAAHRLGGKIILTGILPTVHKSDLELEHMSPISRYLDLNTALLDGREGGFNFRINGLDELNVSHSNVLFEACNTSFQVHLQINATDFVEQYNWAQAIAGPVLAAAVNSPLFLGKRLWQETRIALFRQSVDPRRIEAALRDQRSRVSFGRHWTRSLVDHFRELVTHHRILLTPPIEENALEALAAGKVPRLRALAMHNGTVYRWNRPCYGITNGKPHIRIENRYLPAGPTIVDEVANAAFWLGLMNTPSDASKDIAAKMLFVDALANFQAAARSGLDCQFNWLGQRIPAQQLLLDQMLPLAASGLQRAGVDTEQISKYLSIIQTRVECGQTGANWMLRSHAQLSQQGSGEETLVALVEGTYQRQKSGQPVHCWLPCEIEEGGDWKNRFKRVDQLMSRGLVTVQASDLVALARNLMRWSNIHHVPVEDAAGHLVGLVSIEQLLDLTDPDALIGSVMQSDPVCVAPELDTIEALKVMREKELSCLPVVTAGHLVGILTDRDFAKIAHGLLAA